VRKKVPPGTARLVQQLSPVAPHLLVPAPGGAQLCAGDTPEDAFVPEDVEEPPDELPWDEPLLEEPLPEEEELPEAVLPLDADPESSSADSW
jgi:hypothetical protein